LNLPAAARRFTGSYETGSHTGVFPPTSWLFDDPSPLAADRWHLLVTGAVQRPLRLSYDDLLARGDGTVTALIDCTGGWYSSQDWQGVRLDRLLSEAGLTAEARSVVVVSVTGYRRRFPLNTARGYWLATHVAGQPLSHGHGFPLRLIAPDRRGFDWVKWIVRIEVSAAHAAWQAPLPLQ
jgi:DMSO/TMAO reductase YedYZ molybdopterin-dependent catalytic subunit